MKDKTEGWVLIGHCAVDSGQLMVCDPCYIDSLWSKKEFNTNTDKPRNDFSYDGASTTTIREVAGELDNATACVTSTTYGDGRYPVYVRYEGGSPMEFRIMLDGALLSNNGKVITEDECPECSSSMTEGICDWCYEEDEEV